MQLTWKNCLKAMISLTVGRRTLHRKMQEDPSWLPCSLLLLEEQETTAERSWGSRTKDERVTGSGLGRGQLQLNRMQKLG